MQSFFATRREWQPLDTMDLPRLRAIYGQDLGRVVRNRLNDRTLDAHHRRRWTEMAQQI